MFESNYETVLYTLVVLTLLWLLTRALRFAAEYGMDRNNPAIPMPVTPDSGHHWARGGILFPIHCVLCQSLLLAPAGEDCSGLSCSDCGLACCERPKCLRTAQKAHPCKDIALHRPKDMVQQKEKAEEEEGPKHKHHWVVGNLPLLAECDVCESPCSESPEECLKDLQCCWCHRTIHKDCQPKLSDVCDFGDFREMIIPPNAVTAQPARTVIHPRRWLITKVSTPKEVPNWRPLIVIGNTKAGDNDGAQYLNSFRGQLNPAQVIDLNAYQVEDGLHWCDLITERCIVLIAGGDGTIGWVLNTIDSMKLPMRPLIALLPLGTGNDLARTLGYGAGGDSRDVRAILYRIQSETQETTLDRWKVTLTPLKPKRNNFIKSLKPKKPRTIFIQNYVSVGVDALVTYNFHKTRENTSFVPFSGRLFNKLLYFLYGSKDVLERECKDLDHILELHLDGERVELPNCESVVVLNIPSWGAGVRPWHLGKGHQDFGETSYNDGKLEVFCVYSSFHIAQMQVGLSEPHRIGQAKEVRIVLKGQAPMQTDGEPWLQGPTEILIQFHNAVPVLKVVDMLY